MSEKERALREADKTTDWREVANPGGKAYYFNQKTRQTTWELPEELRRAREAAGHPAEPGPGPPAKRKRLPLPPAVAGAGADAAPVDVAPAAAAAAAAAGAPAPADGDRVAVFKSLLESVGVQVDWTWEATMRQIITDKRYAALRNVAEKKAAFREYVESLREREQREEAERTGRATEAYRALLSERLASGEIGEGMRWRELESRLGREAEVERARAALGARRLEELAREVLAAFEREERERRREEGQRHREAFRAALGEEAWVTFDTPWRQVLEYFFSEPGRENGNGHGAPAAPAFAAMDPTDALEVFKARRAELGTEERERAHAERAARLDAERRNRDAFCALLLAERDAGRLHARSRWKDFILRERENPAYVDVSKNLSGSTPRELFRDVVEDEYAALRDDRRAARAAMRAAGSTCAPGTTLEEFGRLARAAMAGPPARAVSDVNMRLIWEDEVEAAGERRDKEARRAKRARADFADALRSLRAIGAETPWEGALEVLRREEGDLLETLRSNGEDLPALYAEHIAYLQRRREERGADGEEGEVLSETASDTELRKRERARQERKRRRRWGEEEEDEEGVGGPAADPLAGRKRRG